MAEPLGGTDPARERRAIGDLISHCEELRITLRAVAERRRMAAATVTSEWRGPARARFDQGMADLDRDLPELDGRLSALIAELRRRAAAQ